MSDPRFSFDPPQRILLGPGPSDVPARVLQALARPTVGYLDTSYTALMEEVQPRLRKLFKTRNAATFAVTGAGTAAMEAAITNVIEPGDKTVVCVHGYFGDRMRQILERAGAKVDVVEAPWGEPTNETAVSQALARAGRVKALAVVHGETSTGVKQQIAPLAKLAHDHGGLLIADTVASLGGAEFETDSWEADVVYTGSQKCLSVPPGVSPITFSDRAMDVVRNRQKPCQSWYLDALLNLTYWDQPHKYHHTGPINLMYALYEGLRIVEEEGLDARIARTKKTAEALWAGAQALGLKLLVKPNHRLPTLTTIVVPGGVDEAKVRNYLMSEHNIEIAGGLGSLAGRTWRVGLMGASCSKENVLTFLAAFETALAAQGHSVTAGAAVAAATERLS